MCGINGFNWEDTQLLKKMNRAIAHRGPDDEGIYTDGEVSLGNRRLAIIDLSPAAHQPMHNEDNTVWITYNGEIYNFKEIRNDLERKGHEFMSSSDTEVILHGYEEYEKGILEKLNGMFAFAVYDLNSGILMLARDRFGIKPLYYYCEGGSFVFSSEIKGILTHDIRRAPNNDMIFDYLVLGLADHVEETFFENIYRVMPGSYLTFDIKKKEITKEKWYSLRKRVGADVQRIRDSFFRSVRYRLVSDVPVGSCLSGGIDSSSIVCVMKKIAPDSEIKTFSAVFPGKSIDESIYIDEIKKKTSVLSAITSPRAEDLVQDLTDLIQTQEEPFFGTSMYAQYAVMRLAHENGMKVLLDGQGGDELFAGYSFYMSSYFLELFMTLKWKTLLSELLHFLKKHDIRPVPVILSMLPKSALRNARLKSSWIGREFFDSHFRTRKNEYVLTRMLIDTLTYSTIPVLLRYEDKNAMRWSVETRLPFLDHEFVEEVLFLPPEYKIRKGLTKYLFREAMKGILPETIRERTDKIGFATPEEEWLTSGLFIDMAETIINSNSFKKRIYWDWKRVREDFEKYKRKEKNISYAFWKWINLELWLRMFIDE
ncbi:MAG: asparagine synthase (glutamine-hydrolyzing) [Theionarchaea archaeon]|nr:MAG: hypothetical protein AYK19_00340 [Theionarchaea archaeon DG-70-1]MBU7025620.1 asparagine synthase (glutamine-hydrolyzing) [Theionarchaea archaeon]